jgi:hypothetical protein
MSLDKLKKSKGPGTDRRWTLLFIGDHGNVVTLKRFKAIVLVTAIVFFVAIGAVAFLIFMNKGTLEENQEYRKRIGNSQKQIEKLRHEKEILMARLVLAESKVKERLAVDRQSQVEKKPADQTPQKSLTASKIETVKDNKKMPVVPEATQPKPVSLESRDTDPVFSAAVENFKISRELDSANLNAEFKIKNTSPGDQKLAGHAVVVLRGNDLPKHKWLVMPAVGLVGDKPSGRRGKKFSIQRFRTMNFASRAPNHSDEFRTAVVFVFSKTGELLLEQDFAVKLPPPPVSKSETPPAEVPSAETPPAETPPAETPLAETPLAETPPVETPPAGTPPAERSSDDDALKSLKDITPEL